MATVRPKAKTVQDIQQEESRDTVIYCPKTGYEHKCDAKEAKALTTEVVEVNGKPTCKEPNRFVDAKGFAKLIKAGIVERMFQPVVVEKKPSGTRDQLEGLDLEDDE